MRKNISEREHSDWLSLVIYNIHSENYVSCLSNKISCLPVDAEPVHAFNRIGECVISVDCDNQATIFGSLRGSLHQSCLQSLRLDYA
jgi:hypothetical protein